LSIWGNGSLTNLDGISDITTIGGELYIGSNNNLTNCCGIKHLLSDSGAIGGSIYINDNPSECSSEYEILDAECGSTNILNKPFGKMDFSIQPNPTSGLMEISFSKNVKAAIEVKEITGKSLIRRSTEKNQVTLNLSRLPNGLYLVSIQTGGNVVTKKVVLQK